MSQRARAGTQQPSQRAQQVSQAKARSTQQGPVSLNDVHRQMFLQSLMQAMYMTEDSCRNLLARICGSDALYSTVLRELNERIAFSSLKIKTIQNPVDGKRYVGLVNTLEDKAAENASEFTIPQRDFFRAMVSSIAESPNEVAPGVPYAPEMTLLNLEARAVNATQATQGEGTQAGNRTTKAEKSKVIRELVVTGWLSSTPGMAGFYCLGPRTLLELGDHLLNLELAGSTRDVWQDVL